MRRILLWAPLALFLLLMALVWTGLVKPGNGGQTPVRSALIGKPVPAFALPPLVPGKPGVATATFAGKPRLVNVFASWCVPCAAEAEQLGRLKAAGAIVEGVAVRDTAADVRAFLDRYGDGFTSIGDDRERKVQLLLGSAGVPETFVVDARGTIVDQHIGAIMDEDVPKLLAALEKAK